jgi:serine/threonine protein kinase
MLPLEDAIAMIFQTTAGTHHLHSKGIAHRDIRGANILVYSVKPFRVKLADFGFSCSLDVGADGQRKSYARTTLKMPTSMYYTPVVSNIAITSWNTVYGTCVHGICGCFIHS